MLSQSNPPVLSLCRWQIFLWATSLLVTAGAAIAADTNTERIRPDMTKLGDPTRWSVHNRAATLLKEGSISFVRLSAAKNDGLAWLTGSDFSEGTIELDLRGRNAPGQSFVGVAFRGEDNATYDAVYFRPFNFAIADPARRARAVQYISMPQFPWEKLRAEMPSRYEQPVSPVPEPDGWFHARIVISQRTVSVYVADADRPCLVVTELSNRAGGKIGLWVGNGSSGDFANLKITPRY